MELHHTLHSETVNGIFGWRLHWIYCDLTRLDFPLKTEDQLRTDMESARYSFDRLVWEYKTMRGMDYESEAMKEIVRIPQYLALQSVMEKHAEALTRNAGAKAERVIREAANTCQTYKLPAAQEAKSHE